MAAICLGLNVLNLLSFAYKSDLCSTFVTFMLYHYINMAVLKISGKLAWSCKQLQLLWPPDLWYLQGAALLRGF